MRPVAARGAPTITVRAVFCQACGGRFHPADTRPATAGLCPPCAGLAMRRDAKCQICQQPRLLPQEVAAGWACRSCTRDERDVLRAVAILGESAMPAVANRCHRLTTTQVSCILIRLWRQGSIRASLAQGVQTWTVAT